MDIPEDIMKAAKETWDCIGDPNLPGFRVEVIADAILAERERCASIAEMYIINGNRIHPDVAVDQMGERARDIAHMTCQNVAAAIRGDQ